jgi:hypothetical protein
MVSSFPPRSFCFQMTLAVFLATPAPVHLRSRVHPLVSFASSTEFVAVSDLLANRNRLTPSLGFCSSFATPALGVHLSAGFPNPAYVPPTVFLTLSTVYSSLRLAGLFHPTRHVRGSPYRVYCPTLSRPGSSPARALLTFRHPAPLQPSCPAYTSAESLASRALIRAPIR